MLPPDLAAALDRATWPDAAAARGLLTRGVRGDARGALVRWAFDAARSPDGIGSVRTRSIPSCSTVGIAPGSTAGESIATGGGRTSRLGASLQLRPNGENTV
jgi:hypothetical protein